MGGGGQRCVGGSILGWGAARRALTGRRMKNMVRAPTMGTSPSSGSRMTRSVPWSWEEGIGGRGGTSQRCPPPHNTPPELPPPHLHALHPRLAEELLHLHVDLHITHVAVGEGMLPGGGLAIAGPPRRCVRVGGGQPLT